MNFTKVLLFSATLALGVASAASRYSVTLSLPAEVAGKQLKAGNYKVQVEGNDATITGEGATVHATVKSEQNASKYPANSVLYDQAGGKNRVDEVHIGGTTTKLVFTDSAPSNGN